MNNQTLLFSQILKEVYDRAHTDQNITMDDIMEELLSKLAILLQENKEINNKL